MQRGASARNALSPFAGYEQEQTAIRQTITEAESAMASFELDTANVEQRFALEKRYTDFSELTTLMINEFIDKIIIRAPEKVDGDRTQQVGIHLKFTGRFDLPAPERADARGGNAAGRSLEYVCGNCVKAFTATRSDVKYRCEACQRTAHRKMQYWRK